jgi:hypothetical protein
MAGLANGELNDQEELELSFYADASRRSVVLNQPKGHVCLATGSYSTISLMSMYSTTRSC